MWLAFVVIAGLAEALYVTGLVLSRSFKALAIIMQALVNRGQVVRQSPCAGTALGAPPGSKGPQRPRRELGVVQRLGLCGVQDADDRYSPWH